MFSLFIFPVWWWCLHVTIVHFDALIIYFYLSILFTDIVDTYFVLRLTFILCVFDLFIVHYEEANLPLYVKGWSGRILSFKGPLKKVRFLCYGVYLVHHELMHVFIISSAGDFADELSLVIVEKKCPNIYNNLHLNNTIPMLKSKNRTKGPRPKLYLISMIRSGYNICMF